ncbi:MAG: caspase family protein, partial [Planctomycetaceae bacterium]|nr:caspase family protein [Planctomycetaceae bacterium]
VILHACSAGEICLEAEDENGGLFSSAYQRMLAKARAAGDEVDFAELADGVRTDVTNYVRLNKLDRQTPTIVGTLEPSKLSVSGRKVIAITVGVDRNADPDYPPLRFAASDARRVGTELRQWGADVRQLTGKVGEEDAATKAKILAAIEQAVLENASVLFVHFAGNGIQDPQTLKQSLLPADGRLDVPASLLQVEELQTALTPFPGTVILSIDACRSDSPVAAVASDKSPAPPAPPPSPR